MCEGGGIHDEAEDQVVVHDEEAAQALAATGAILVRHAHQMRLGLPLPAAASEPIWPEFMPFAPGGHPPVPWPVALPAFLAAYPPGHPDHLPGGADLIESYLLPYTVGARLGPLLCHASAIASRGGRAYAGILVVDRRGEGPWVCDVWRDPDPAYAGTGSALLAWAASRLEGYDSLSLVVTAGNAGGLRAYERVGFTIVSTAWRFQLP